MNYKHKANRNLLILDGSDTTFSEIAYETNCPSCLNKISYKINSSKNLSLFPNDLQEYAIKNNIISDTFETKKNIPAYIINGKCKQCNLIYYLIIGIFESQPQRFKVYYKSTIYEVPS